MNHPDEPLYDTITTRIPAKTNVRLMAHALSKKIPRAEVVRMAIEEYLETHTGKAVQK